MLQIRMIFNNREHLLADRIKKYRLVLQMSQFLRVYYQNF